MNSKYLAAWIRRLHRELYRDFTINGIVCYYCAPLLSMLQLLLHGLPIPFAFKHWTPADPPVPVNDSSMVFSRPKLLFPTLQVA